MDFSNILSHPDHEEIVSRLVIGDSAKDIAQWLKIKYPEKEQKHLNLSSKSLQEYADKHIDLMGQIRKDIAAVKEDSTDPKIQKAISQSIINNKTYRERVMEYVNTEVDIKKMITELVLMCRDRMEQVFDRIQENPTNMKGDYVLVKYFETLFVALEKFDKIVNNAPDQIIQHNVTVQAIDQHVALLQEAIRRTLAKMDVDASMVFMDDLTEELRKLSPPAIKTPTIESREADAQLLREMSIPKLPE